MMRNGQAVTVSTSVLSILLTCTVVGTAEAHPGAQHSVEAKVKGTLQSIQNDRYVVADHEFLVTRATDIEDHVRPGDYVCVEAEQDANGTWVAQEIDRKHRPWRPTSSIQYRLKGSLEAMVGDMWTVAGKEFSVTPRTSMQDSVYVGASVKVDAYQDSDGKLVATEVDSKEKRRR